MSDPAPIVDRSQSQTHLPKQNIVARHPIALEPYGIDPNDRAFFHAEKKARPILVRHQLKVGNDRAKRMTAILIKRQ